MDNYLKSYDMVIHTKGPVFVGSGKDLNKKEYILLRNKKKVLIPDLGHMYSELQKKGLGKPFERYIMSDQRDVMRIDLKRWLEENRIEEKVYRMWVRYELDCGDFLQERGAIQICEFQKDAYGLPYVPGTALKGMFRTILLAYELLKKGKAGESLQNQVYRTAQRNDSRKNYLRKENMALEEQVFHTLDRKDRKGKSIDRRNAVNDCLSGLIVSDSEPFALEDLTLCQKLDENTQGRQRTLNILRESVKPARDIKFRITIDEKLCPYTIEQLLEAVNLFGEAYYSMYLSHFEHGKRPEKNTVWLGGGTGFFTKTALYPLLGHDRGLETAQNVFRNTLPNKKGKEIYFEHKHDEDKKLGVSPHILKGTRYRGQWYQMGECVLSIAEEH